jgi:hypothetical protein
MPPASPSVPYLRPAAAGFFFSPLTRALKSAPARSRGTEDLGTLMDAPVAGLRAVRAGRSVFSKTPDPVIATLSRLATVDWMVPRTAFTASVAVFLSPTCPKSHRSGHACSFLTPAVPQTGSRPTRRLNRPRIRDL